MRFLFFIILIVFVLLIFGLVAKKHLRYSGKVYFAYFSPLVAALFLSFTPYLIQPLHDFLYPVQKQWQCGNEVLGLILGHWILGTAIVIIAQLCIKRWILKVKIFSNDF